MFDKSIEEKIIKNNRRKSQFNFMYSFSNLLEKKEEEKKRKKQKEQEKKTDENPVHQLLSNFLNSYNGNDVDLQTIDLTRKKLNNASSTSRLKIEDYNFDSSSNNSKNKIINNNNNAYELKRYNSKKSNIGNFVKTFSFVSRENSSSNNNKFIKKNSINKNKKHVTFGRKSIAIPFFKKKKLEKNILEKKSTIETNNIKKTKSFSFMKKQTFKNNIIEINNNNNNNNNIINSINSSNHNIINSINSSNHINSINNSFNRLNSISRNNSININNNNNGSKFSSKKSFNKVNYKLENIIKRNNVNNNNNNFNINIISSENSNNNNNLNNNLNNNNNNNNLNINNNNLNINNNNLNINNISINNNKDSNISTNNEINNICEILNKNFDCESEKIIEKENNMEVNKKLLRKCSSQKNIERINTKNLLKVEEIFDDNKIKKFERKKRKLKTEIKKKNFFKKAFKKEIDISEITENKNINDSIKHSKIFEETVLELTNIQKTIRTELFGDENDDEDDYDDYGENKDNKGFEYKSKLSLKKMTTNLFEREKRFRSLFRVNKLYDSLLDDAEEEDNDELEKGKFYIEPNGVIKYILDSLLTILCLIDIYLLSGLLAISNDPLQLTTLNLCLNIIVEVFYIIDFISGFFIAYYNKDEILITKFNLLVNNYYEHNLISDFLIAIPFSSIIYFSLRIDILPYSSSYNNPKNIYFLLTFIRKFKITKILSEKRNSIMNYLSNFEYYTFYGSVYIYLLIFTVIIHNVSCIYIFMGKVNYPNWIVHLNLNNNEFIKIYICAMYYIISTLTTVGYGDISTYTCGERIFGGILLLFGIMGYSIALTSVSNYIKKMNSKTEEFENKRKILDEISMNNNCVKKNLYEKVLRHLKYQDNEKNVNNIIIENLPLGLRNNLLMAMYKNIIDNFMFFKNLNNTDFIVQILLAFKPVLALKNDVLIKDGDFMEEIIFVKNGKLNLEVPIDISDKYEFGEFRNNNNKEENNNEENIKQKNTKNPMIKNKSNSIEEKSSNEEEETTQYINILVLNENEHFGIVSLYLNKKSPLRCRVRSKKAELLFLNKKDIYDISQSYPQIWKKINKKSIHNFLQIENLITKTLQIYYMSNGIKHEIFNKNNDMFDIEEENSNDYTEEESEDKDEISKNLYEASENMINNMNQTSLKNKNKEIDEIKESSSSFYSSSSGVSNYKNNQTLMKSLKSKKFEDEKKSFLSSKNYKSKKTNNIDNKTTIKLSNLINENNDEFFDNLKFNSEISNKSNNENVNLTPFKSFEINDEIYPNEEFIISNISKNNSDLTTISNVINNNSKKNTNNINNNNNENKEIFFHDNFIISSNEINFFIESSYENINFLSGNNYINDKNLQQKIKSLFGKKSIMKKSSLQLEIKKKRKKNLKKIFFYDEKNKYKTFNDNDPKKTIFNSNASNNNYTNNNSDSQSSIDESTIKKKKEKI